MKKYTQEELKKLEARWTELYCDDSENLDNMDEMEKIDAILKEQEPERYYRTFRD
jgi:hypothetical protein